jgi:Ca2+-binding EF-hand superfamily protein
MSDLRFKINMENIDLRKLFDDLGFDDKTELIFRSFDEFVRMVNPSITTEEVVYFFEKLDVNDDGKVSIK